MLNIRVRVVASWALAILLFFTYLTVAPPKLLGDPGWMQRFDEWGYSTRFASGIGMVELIAAALLLFPSLAFYGAGILTLVLAGAIAAVLVTSLSTAVSAGEVLFCVLPWLSRASCKLVEEPSCWRSERSEPPWYRAALQPAHTAPPF